MAKNNDVAQENRRTKVAQLMATMRRPSVRKITEALSKLKTPIMVGKSTIGRDMKAIRAEWRNARAADMDVVVGGEIEKLDLEEEQCYAALQASMQPLVERKTVTQRVPIQIDDDTVRYYEKTTTHNRTVERTADPRYFRALVDIKKRRAELLGLDAPKGIDVTSLGKRIEFECAPGFDDWQPPERTPSQQKDIDTLREEIDQLKDE